MQVHKRLQPGLQPGLSGASSGRGFRMFARGPGLSIRDRLLRCASPAEVHALLADTLLVPASPSTRRSWHRAADSRLAQLARLTHPSSSLVPLVRS